MTMRLLWMTDIHLNFVSPQTVKELVKSIVAESANAVLIGGDIAEANSIEPSLIQLAQGVQVPLYFVLGNHDYYGGSIAKVREAISRLTPRVSNLTWLPQAGVVQLTKHTSLIGHGGWGDGRAGEYHQSDVLLNDYFLIDELHSTHRCADPDPKKILCDSLQATLNQLGDEAAAHLRRHLTAALETSRQVVLLTHVPPFRETCWHNGVISDDNWAPHFTCQAVGDVLKEIMSSHRQQQLTVLCGHTHSSGLVDILPNLKVLTGEAVCGQPRVQDVWEIP
jgi:predicted MPP superfamily phosphohydrolase